MTREERNRRRREEYAKDSTKALEQNRRWKAANPDKVRKSNRTSYEKDQEARKAYQREYNSTHRAETRVRNQQRYRKHRLEYAAQNTDKRAQLASYKRFWGCLRCDEKNPRLLDFHHRDPADKSFGLGDYHRHGMKTIMAEVEKCDVMCKKHHVMAHREMKG